MKSLKLERGFFPQKIELPSSKSYANRALVLAALDRRIFKLRNLPQASDVEFLVQSFSAIGLKINRDKQNLTIENSFPDCESMGAEITVGEGGTTARFLAAMLLRGSAPYTLILGPRLKHRPWMEFVDFTVRHGAKASLNDNKLFLQGPLKLPTQVKVDCSRTTQFASGLQLAFPECRVIPENLQTSLSYWEMSENIIKDLKNSEEYVVPLDWSSASYPLAFGALNQAIHFPGLHHDPFQADAKFLKLLESFGSIKILNSGLNIQPVQSPHTVDLIVSDCLDLVPALSFLLSHIEGKHYLRGVANLVHKESDRLSEIIKLLQQFGRKTEVSDDTLIIWGSTELVLTPQRLLLPDDHRIVMTGALFLKHHAGGEIGPVGAVNKSYPGFFDLIV